MLLPSLSKLKLFVFGLTLLSLFLSANPALAYVSIRDPSAEEYKRDIWEPAVYGTDEMNLESFTNESFLALIASLLDLFGEPINEEYRRARGPGAIMAAAGVVALMYAVPPASGVEYLADIGSSLGLAKPAHAQGAGVGFEALTPVRPIWQAFRNMAYVLFVVIFVLIGLAIMFRVRLNPQTVIGIQNAIPRLVVALLLVTFSYAIAGFLIDLIYVLIFLTISFLRASGLMNPTGIGNEIVNALILQGNALVLALVIILLSIGNITAGISSIFGASPGSLFVPNMVGLTIPLVPVFKIIGGLMIGVSLILVLIFLIVLFISLLRLIWVLLTSYIAIVFAVIFAPFQLLLGALPAVETFGFSAWIRGLVANVIVFPATLVLLLLAHILMGPTQLLPQEFLDLLGPFIDEGACGPAFINLFGINCNVGFGAQGQRYLPPLIGTGLSTQGIQVLIGLGIMVMLPGILNRIKEAIRGRIMPIEFFGRTEQAAVMGTAGFVYGLPRVQKAKTKLEREHPAVRKYVTGPLETGIRAAGVKMGR